MAWEKPKLPVDGDATEAIALDSKPTAIHTTPRGAIRKEMEYEAANGATIHDEAETRFNAVTALCKGSTQRSLKEL